ncbi:MAG TPA: RIP metalloprotease RseP, partial [Allocoleopsis sp.]
MTNIIGSLGAIAVLAVLVLVHELGHFLAAKFQGIHVSKFSLGFGPALWTYQGTETEYAIRALPLGGYVGFPDDDPENNIPLDDPNLLRNRPIIDRAIVISAGVMANFIFAYFALVLQLGIAGVTDLNYQPGVVITNVASEVSSAAMTAGVKSGDIVLLADGTAIKANKNAVPDLVNIIKTHPNQEIKLSIQRQGQIISLSVTPEPDIKGEGKIGVQLSPNATLFKRKVNNITEAFSKAANEYEQIFKVIIQGFTQLITKFQETADHVAGPVAIVAMGADIVKDDVTNLLHFAALISVNLGIINILPLPALDGGQLVFLLFEAILGKPLPNKLQEGVMQTGLVLLLGLGIVLILRDTSKLL